MQEKDILRFEGRSPLRMVSRLHRLNLNALAGPLAGLGIARGTMPFIMEVLSRENVTQEEISRSLSIDRAATARALQQLEEDGLVLRREDPDDRRCKRVCATQKARTLSDRIMAVLAEQRGTLFAGFTDREEALFLDMLDRMTASMLERNARKAEAAHAPPEGSAGK